MKSTQSATLSGLNAKAIEVESTLTKGLPAFTIVGLATNSIQESKDRIKSALLSNNFTFPPLRITINLSPSDIKKSGSHLDLPIALLIALNSEEFNLDQWFIFGELGLDGSIKDSPSIFTLVLSLIEQGKSLKLLIPKASVHKISFIPNVSYIGVSTLNEAIDILKNNVSINTTKLTHTTPSITIDQVYFYEKNYPYDFNEVKGQEVAKRASLISAAGLHNMLLSGSPGCGKSMIAKRFVYIMPPVSQDELLSIAKNESLSGKEPNFKPQRPFRNPHHTSTKSSIFGGGSQNAQIGEIALSHLGLLFFDELPHFQKQILEAMREPLEDGKILISRVNSKVEYPTNFVFLAAQNPCPCGFLLSSIHDCRCTDLEVQRYKNKLSEPFLDRIDLHINMQEVRISDKSSISSKEMHQKVLQAFFMQKNRGQSSLNGKLTEKEINKFIKFDNVLQTILDQAITKFGLSLRSINKILKLSRTIADLEEKQDIEKKHLLEALSYRKR